MLADWTVACELSVIVANARYSLYANHEISWTTEICFMVLVYLASILVAVSHGSSRIIQWLA